MTEKRLPFLALTILAAVAGGTMFSRFLAPYNPSFQERRLPWAPPMRLHFMDNQGALHVRPFVYPWVEQSGRYAEYRADARHPQPLYFLLRTPCAGLHDMSDGCLHLFGLKGTERVFLLGTDRYGRDVFSRLLYGGRLSLLAGLLATALSLAIGLLAGSLAGYFRGLAETLLMRFAELFLAIPWLYLLLAVRAILPLRITPAGALLIVVAVIGGVGWARPALLVRSVVLSARERAYVFAARGFGASRWYLLWHHILPETRGVLLTQASLLIPQFILAEVTLSYLGLGFGGTVPSWGTMLAAVASYEVLASYWWMLSPVWVLIALFWAFQSLAGSVEEMIR